MTSKAYLHFGFGTEPRQTVETEHKLAPLAWQAAGLQFNATGYGSRIPTEHMVKHFGRWRRVYVANYGNAGTAYIGKPGDWLATVDLA